MDVNAIQYKLMNEPNLILDILEALHYKDITDRNSYFQFANKDGDNKSGNSIRKSDLVWNNWTRNKKGNLITLVMDDRHCTFPEALRWIGKKIGLVDSKPIQIHLPFCGFYKKLLNDSSAINNMNDSTYSEYNLPMVGSLSKKFFDDGISLLVQEQFGIRYCHEEDSILIPIHNEYGDLVGCKARRNSDSDFSARWYAYLPYAKTHFVYGYYENYKAIISKNMCVIFESEKAVLQCESFGFHVALAIGGHNISEVQVSKIKSLMTSKIIIAFDNDISDEEKTYEARKILNNNNFIKNQVGFIRKNDLLGEKDSPSDKGQEVFKTLIKEYVVWIGEENG